jgi:Lhr-like helicase
MPGSPERGWQVFPFQREVWSAAVAGRSGLLHASTGAGKTYAVWFAAMLRGSGRAACRAGIKVLWITPMRALAADTVRALQDSAAALACHGISRRAPATPDRPSVRGKASASRMRWSPRRKA